MFDEMMFDTLMRYLLCSFQMPHTIDSPIDYELAERVSSLHEVNFYLEKTADEGKKKLVGYKHYWAKDIISEFFPELSGLRLPLDYLYYELENQDNIDKKTSNAIVTEITGRDDYKSFFSEEYWHCQMVKYKNTEGILFKDFDNDLKVGNFLILLLYYKTHGLSIDP